MDEQRKVIDLTALDNFKNNFDSIINNKQNKLTPGNNITIDENNVISSTGSGSGGLDSEPITYDNTEDFIPASQNSIDELRTAIQSKQGKLTAGANITIDENNVISATVSGSSDNEDDGESQINPSIYSTEATIIGTWIDGKPIYRKVVTGGAVAKGATKYYLVDDNIEAFVTVRGMGITGNLYLPIPYLYPGSNAYNTISYGHNYQTPNNPNSVELNVGGSRAFDSVFFIIEYTKITDEATTAYGISAMSDFDGLDITE